MRVSDYYVKGESDESSTTPSMWHLNLLDFWRVSCRSYRVFDFRCQSPQSQWREKKELKGATNDCDTRIREGPILIACM